MRVHVLWFGALKDLLAGEGMQFDLPENATVAELLHRCLPDSAQAKKIAASLAIAVNREYASPTQVLQEGDEVALLPPVSGGAGDEPESQPRDTDNFVRLQHEPICSETLLAALKQGEDGAVTIFDGIVRNNSRGRKTLALEYEAYEAMALEQMRALALDARQRFGIRQAVIVHRLGRLQVGETSVWIAAASAHRAEAFDACRWMIDTLKKTVPIWKREFFVDGAVWADGEPFPKEIPSQILNRPILAQVRQIRKSKLKRHRVASV